MTSRHSQYKVITSSCKLDSCKSLIVGGNILHYNKNGNTRIKLMACYDFVGEVGIATMPVSTYEVQMMKSEEQIAAEARSLFGQEDFSIKVGRCSLNLLRSFPEYLKWRSPILE
jgi:hypothetical protein